MVESRVGKSPLDTAISSFVRPAPRTKGIVSMRPSLGRTTVSACCMTRRKAVSTNSGDANSAGKPLPPVAVKLPFSSRQ